MRLSENNLNRDKCKIGVKINWTMEGAPMKHLFQHEFGCFFTERNVRTQSATKSTKTPNFFVVILNSIYFNFDFTLYLSLSPHLLFSAHFFLSQFLWEFLKFLFISSSVLKVTLARRFLYPPGCCLGPPTHCEQSSGRSQAQAIASSEIFCPISCLWSADYCPSVGGNKFWEIPPQVIACQVCVFPPSSVFHFPPPGGLFF